MPTILSRYWKRIAIAVGALVIAAAAFFFSFNHTSPLPSCVRLDAPTDEGQTLDFDSHNCPGVAYVFTSKKLGEL